MQWWCGTVKGKGAVLAAIFLLALTEVHANSAFRCLDAKGKPLFTDDKRRCHNSGDEAAESIVLREPYVHSQYGGQVSEEYHNYAFRAYAPIPDRTLNIIAEQALIDRDPALLNQAVDKLEQTMLRAIAQFPRHIQPQFSGIKYFLFTGDESRAGGRKGGQWYFRKGNRTSARFDDSIVVRSAKDYLTRYDEQRALRTAVHELAHALYYYQNKALYRDTRAAFDNVEAKQLYRNLPHEKGHVIKKAYALTNHREYFAELCKIYLVGNEHVPMNAEALASYDPNGYVLVKKALSLP